MSGALDTVKTIWEIIKDGGRTSTSGTTVNVLPQGSSVMIFQAGRVL